jgi:hypothetical protein
MLIGEAPALSAVATFGTLGNDDAIFIRLISSALYGVGSRCSDCIGINPFVCYLVLSVPSSIPTQPCVYGCRLIVGEPCFECARDSRMKALARTHSSLQPSRLHFRKTEVQVILK